MSSIAVIGAGITGVTTAYELRKKGYQVTVFDKNRYSGMETSFANGGQLSASNAEVWNSWGTIVKGMGWLFRDDAPLLLNLKPSWHKYSWLAEFVMATRKYRQNTQDTVKLALMARARLHAIADKEGIDFDHEKRGILHFYRDAKSMKSAHKVNKLLTEAGLERREVSKQEIKSLEPSLQGDFEGGFFTENDSTGDIHKFTRGLAERCRSMGVNFHMQTQITSLKANADTVNIAWQQVPVGDGRGQASFDGIVVCAGVGSRAMAKQFGDRVNVYPVKGYSITVNIPEKSGNQVAPWVSLLDEDAKIVTSRLGAGRYRVAGTAEINGYNRDVRDCRITPLIEWVESCHPHLETSQVVPWAGLRPMMPDMMPRVRRGKHPRVFYNTGHGHLGWTLSAATAEMVAELVNTALIAERPVVSSGATLNLNNFKAA